MRKLFLASVIVLAAIPAYAGSLAIILTSGPLTGTVTATISDADATKFVAYAQASYPTRPNPAFDPACTQACAPATLPNNAAQALSAWASGIFAGTVANVQSYQQSVATKAASDGVAPISIK